MGLHRVRGRLQKQLAEHAEGERDGHEPTAEAHRVFASQYADDLAAVEAAIASERDLDEARAQLAALHAAAQRFRDAVSDDGLTCRDNGLDSAAAVEEEWEAIDRVLADLATAAAEHERSVRADERAKALREARDAIEMAFGHDEDVSAQDVIDRLLADEAERGTR